MLVADASFCNAFGGAWTGACVDAALEMANSDLSIRTVLFQPGRFGYGD